MKIIFSKTLMLIACVLISRCAVADKTYDTQEKEGYWSIFLRTKTDSPSEELTYARQLEEDGRNWSARRRYSAVVKYWPTSPEAPRAQLARARLLEEKGKIKDAFEEYQKLFDKYPGTFPTEQVLQRQFEIAVEVMNAKKLKFLFGGLSDPEEAVPLFEKIVANAPEWERTPNAQFLIGEAYERAKRYELAVPAYQAVELRYPGNPLASRAAFKKCELLFNLSQRHENDGKLRKKTYSELTLFLSRYPQSKFRDRATEMAHTQYERMAKASYDIAVYYDDVAGKPEAALNEYRRLSREFPSSKWTEKSAGRINELEAKIEGRNENN